MVRDSGLTDFPFKGLQFTSEKKRGAYNWVEENLDRILVSGSWG